MTTIYLGSWSESDWSLAGPDVIYPTSYSLSFNQVSISLGTLNLCNGYIVSGTQYFVGGNNPWNFFSSTINGGTG